MNINSYRIFLAPLRADFSQARLNERIAAYDASNYDGSADYFRRSHLAEILISGAPRNFTNYPTPTGLKQYQRLHQFSAVLVGVSLTCTAVQPCLWPSIVGSLVLLGGTLAYYHCMAEIYMHRASTRGSEQSDNCVNPDAFDGRHLSISLSEPIDAMSSTDENLGLVASASHRGYLFVPALGSVHGGVTSRGSAGSTFEGISLAKQGSNAPDCLLVGTRHVDWTNIAHLAPAARVVDALRHLSDESDPVQVRSAIKSSIDFSWLHHIVSDPDDRLVEHYAYCGVLFRGSYMYAYNMGTNRIILCGQGGPTRLTVDHGIFDTAESAHRDARRTESMSRRRLSRIAEISADQNAERQTVQVGAHRLDKSKGRFLVLYDANISLMLSDKAINGYVVGQQSLGKNAQEIAVGLYEAARVRHLMKYGSAGQNAFSGHVAVIMPPSINSANARPSKDVKDGLLVGLEEQQDRIRDTDKTRADLLESQCFEDFLNKDPRLKDAVVGATEEIQSRARVFYTKGRQKALYDERYVKAHKRTHAFLADL